MAQTRGELALYHATANLLTLTLALTATATAHLIAQCNPTIRFIALPLVSQLFHTLLLRTLSFLSLSTSLLCVFFSDRFYRLTNDSVQTLCRSAAHHSAPSPCVFAACQSMSLVSSNWAKMQAKNAAFKARHGIASKPKAAPAPAAVTAAGISLPGASALQAGGGLIGSTSSVAASALSGQKRKRGAAGASAIAASTAAAATAAAATTVSALAPVAVVHGAVGSSELTTHIAIDCEMVGVGRDGIRSALARCSVVNYDGHVLYDRYVRPLEPVTDYRTHVSGIEPHHIAPNAPNCVELNACRTAVTALLSANAGPAGGRILVGHSLRNDMEVLMLSHPPQLVRDTAQYKPFCPHRPRALRKLVAEHLNIAIHQNKHDSVTHSTATNPPPPLPRSHPLSSLLPLRVY